MRGGERRREDEMSHFFINSFAVRLLHPGGTLQVLSHDWWDTESRRKEQTQNSSGNQLQEERRERTCSGAADTCVLQSHATDQQPGMMTLR